MATPPAAPRTAQRVSARQAGWLPCFDIIMVVGIMPMNTVCRTCDLCY